MIAAGFVVAVLAFLVSLAFNYLQYSWRKEDKAQRDRERNETIAERVRQDAEQRRLERTPPEIYNFGGGPNPIRISGSKKSGYESCTDVWGPITVVNPTSSHMKIEAVRLVIDGAEYRFERLEFRVKENDRERYERISMMGNEKTDYHLMLTFHYDKVPHGYTGELWLKSSNRPDEPFSVPIYFV